MAHAQGPFSGSRGQFGATGLERSRETVTFMGCYMRQNLLLLGIVFLALSLCAPAICAASENCPWLNAATAAGALKGSVTFTVTHPGADKTGADKTGADKTDATCEFIHREGAVLSKLQIEVETMKDPRREFASYTAKCGRNATPLRAIGNEALLCSLRSKDRFSEQVVSRVRERAFLVRVSSNSSGPERTELLDKSQKIAEQVAGFLF